MSFADGAKMLCDIGLNSYQTAKKSAEDKECQYSINRVFKK